MVANKKLTNTHLLKFSLLADDDEQGRENQLNSHDNDEYSNHSPK